MSTQETDRHLESELRQAMTDYQLPDYMADGVIRFVLHGIPPGDFLQAVLANDLMEAVGRADRDNQIALVQWAKFVYNELPSPCWGSRAKIASWINAKYQERQKTHCEEVG